LFKIWLFCDKIEIMKNNISFLAITGVMFCVNNAMASECIGDDCELTPIVIEQDFETADYLEPIECDVDWGMENDTCYDYDCPFDTADECEIWYKKPIHKTNTFPRAPHINPVRVDDMLYSIYSNYNVDANDSSMSPLLERYQILMRASHACCTDGIIYKMRQNGANDAAIYQFLKDDANYFAVTSRCMVMNDNEIRHTYSNGVTGKMVADVRNACLCKNKKWFETLLQPFNDIYERAPQFKDTHFIYTYTDGMQRDITVYINDEVQTTSGLLSVCPK